MFTTFWLKCPGLNRLSGFASLYFHLNQYFVSIFCETTTNQERLSLCFPSLNMLNESFFAYFALKQQRAKCAWLFVVAYNI